MLRSARLFFVQFFLKEVLKDIQRIAQLLQTKMYEKSVFFKF